MSLYGILTLYLRFVKLQPRPQGFSLGTRLVKLCRENKSDTVVCLMTNQRSLYRG